MTNYPLQLDNQSSNGSKNSVKSHLKHIAADELASCIQSEKCVVNRIPNITLTLKKLQAAARPQFKFLGCSASRRYSWKIFRERQAPFYLSHLYTPSSCTGDACSCLPFFRFCPDLSICHLDKFPPSCSSAFIILSCFPFISLPLLLFEGYVLQLMEIFTNRTQGWV